MFDLRWFDFSAEVAMRQLDFSHQFSDFLNPTEYHYSITENHITVTHKDLKTNKFLKLVTIKRMGKHLIDYDYGHAIESPLIYAIGVKMGYLKLPKKWIRVSQWGNEGDYQHCRVVHEDDSNRKMIKICCKEGSFKIPRYVLLAILTKNEALPEKKQPKRKLQSESELIKNPFRK
jgi:hypothetical protein